MPFDGSPERIPDVALVLDRAADLVERGWCRFTVARRRWFRDGNAYCAIGAINRAKCELDVPDPLGESGRVVAQIAAEAGYCEITAWNDALRLGRQRVVAAGLREARDRVIAAERRKPRVREMVTAAFLALVLLCGPAWAQSTPSGTPTINQGRQARLLVKSDATVIPRTRGLFIGDAVACNVALLFSGDTAAVTFNSVQSGALLPFSITKLMSTGTSCTSVIALY